MLQASSQERIWARCRTKGTPPPYWQKTRIRSAGYSSIRTVVRALEEEVFAEKIQGSLLREDVVRSCQVPWPYKLRTDGLKVRTRLASKDFEALSGITHTKIVMYTCVDNCSPDLLSCLRSIKPGAQLHTVFLIDESIKQS